MAKLKKGQKLTCIPCGRQVIVDACGISRRTIWCCGKPMSPKSKSKSKSSSRKK
ncbi:MAG: hypothetical protein WC469_01905 [Candidatus Omnitrophota bacterium]